MGIRRLFLVGVVAIGVLSAVVAAAGAPATTGRAPVGPLSPEASRGAMELEAGLEVELVAAEPLVRSPCAVAWDERGRMFVAENSGYPTGGPGGEAMASVAMLEDTDGDGIPDKRTVYVEGLTFPNGVMPWRGGVIVTCAPDVWYFKDSKGDGHVDVREVLLTGFDTKGSTQLRVNTPLLGPDGWVYLAGGLSGGVVYSPKHPERKVDTRRSDVKFRPDTGEIELVDGKGQFGQTFDDAGHRFVCMNRVQVQYAPLPARYLARNPHVTPPGVLDNCPEDRVVDKLLGTGEGAGSRVFPISANVTTADSHAGTYTAACGVHIAKGDALPKEYVGLAWSCEPTGNLARCDELVPVGGSFHARRMHEGTEAVRSRDDWFRPVFLADGPDGALYVCDMYRRVIEHPDYLPEEVRKRSDFVSGKEMGRIWRVYRAGMDRGKLAEAAKGHRGLMRDGPADAFDAALKSADGWTRATAFRLAIEQPSRIQGPAPPAPTPTPGKPDTSEPKPVAAAWVPPAATEFMEGLHLAASTGAEFDFGFLTALYHPDPGVREVGVRLSESRLNDLAALRETVLTLAGDPDVRVRYAVVLALGGVKRDRAGVVEALERLALRDGGDKWFRAAILTSVPTADDQWELLRQLVRQPPSTGTLALVQDLVKLLNAGADEKQLAGNLDRVRELWPRAADEDVRAAILLGYADRGAGVLRGRVGEGEEFAATIERARAVAIDAKAASDARVRAIALLGVAVDAGTEGELLGLVSGEQPTEIAVAAARALAQGHHAGVMAKLLAGERWRAYPPTLRGAILTSIVGRPELAGALLGAIERGDVPARALLPSQRDWLRKLNDPDLRGRAEKALAAAGGAGDRRKAYEETKAAVMGLKPVPGHGQRVFRDNCTSCHRLDREGVAVGPDLLDVRNQPKETILLHVVIPELEIAPNFTCYRCVTKDGRSVTGIMVADTPASVTLRQPLAVDETIQRDQIRSLEASELSLMPDGLEKAMTAQDMADLLSYLRGEE